MPNEAPLCAADAGWRGDVAQPKFSGATASAAAAAAASAAGGGAAPRWPLPAPGEAMCVRRRAAPARAQTAHR